MSKYSKLDAKTLAEIARMDDEGFAHLAFIAQDGSYTMESRLAYIANYAKAMTGDLEGHMGVKELVKCI